MNYTLRDLLSTVFRHARGLLIFWVVTVIAVLVFYSQSKKLYDSKAKILVTLGSEVQGKAVFLDDHDLQLVQRQQQVRDEQQILESHDVLLVTAKWIMGDPTPGSTPPPRTKRVETAKRYMTGVAPEPTLLLRGVHAVSALAGKMFSKRQTHQEQLEDMARELSHDLSVKPVFNSDALDVTFRYRNARVAQTILRLIMASYMDHHIHVYQSPAEEDLLKSQYQGSFKDYRNRLAKMSKYMKDNGVYNNDSQMNTLIETHERLRQALNQARSDQSYDTARLAELMSIKRSLRPLSQYSSTEVRNKERDALLARLNNAILAQKALLARHTRSSRVYKDQLEKLAAIRKLVNAQPRTVTEQTEQRRTRSSELVGSDIVSVKEAKRGDQARIRQISADLKKNDAHIKTYATKLQGFDALKLNVALAKDQTQEIAKAYVDSHVRALTSKNAITDVSLIDGPTWDWKPASPKKKLVAAAAILLLLFGSVAVIIILIAMEETLPDPETTALSLGSQVAGTFPLVTNAKGDELLQQFEADYQDEFAHMYLALPAPSERGRVIVLASSHPGEGATVLGFGLAKFLSRNVREKTAFYDATENSVPDEMARRANSDLLTVVPTPETREEVSALLKQLRRENQNVVVAMGAVRNSAGLMVLRGLSPTTFLLVEAAKTRRAAARSSLATLRKFGFENVKLLLNKRKHYIPAWMMRFV